MTLSEKIKGAIRTIPDFPEQGVQYKDISTLFLKPELINEILLESIALLQPYNVEVIAGIESRGFLLGAAIAAKMKLPFVMIRKAGKLPAKTYQETYQLEYGTATIEMHCDAIQSGKRVAVIDDVLATGGTLGAASNLIRRAGSEPVVACFIAELEFLNGRQKLETAGTNVLSVVKY
jgi:adenine phosphoribosyltransferase